MIVEISLAVVYVLCGAGTTSLVRIARPDLPKIIGILWPLFLLFAAFGFFDEDRR